MKASIKRVTILVLLIFGLSFCVVLGEDESSLQSAQDPVLIKETVIQDTEVPETAPQDAFEDMILPEEPAAVGLGSEEPSAEAPSVSDEPKSVSGEALAISDEPVTAAGEEPAISDEAATGEDAEPVVDEVPASGEDPGAASDNEMSVPEQNPSPAPKEEPAAGEDPDSGDEPGPVVHEAKIIEEKGNLYYIDPDTGEIRTAAGFIKFGGKLCYIREGGRIAVNMTVKDGDSKYHAGSDGAILKGLHMWKDARYYSGKTSGKLRSTRGFVRVNGKKYHVYTTGKVAVNKLFGFKGKRYIAGKAGTILKGVHKWKGKYYYSEIKSGIIRPTQGLVKHRGKKYFIEKGGVIRTSLPFFYRNRPYFSNGKGICRLVTAMNVGKVAKIAEKQVGIMTGSTYWTWYFGTRFVDTDITPWCGTFIAWCYNAAGRYSKVAGIKRYGNLGYVPSYSRYANAHNKWIDRSKAKGGDIIVFGADMHVGIVEYVYKGYVFTIEGNAGPTAAVGCGKPGAVVRKLYRLDDPRIKGILRV